MNEEDYEHSKTYTLIWNDEPIKRFQELFVKDLDEQNVKLLYLAARRKYDDSQPLAGSTCFNRQFVKRGSDDLYDLIRRYEVPRGTYKTKDGTPIKASALVVYFLLNPRNTVTGYTKFATKMSERVCRQLAHRSNESFDNILSELKSCIHSSPGGKPYIELDVDTKDALIVKKVIDVVNAICRDKHVCTVETHGGYHIILHKLPKDVKSRIWQEFNKSEYKFEGTDFNGKAITKSYVDVRSDPSPPIPGTLQGGFPVCFRELDDLDPEKGKWMYTADNGKWQDFPVNVSQEFRLEAQRDMACAMTTEYKGVEYRLDFTTDVATIDGKRVLARYIRAE